jgi:hypothetical protein
MNRHVKECLIDALLFSIPAVFISFAFISIYARENNPKLIKPDLAAHQKNHLQHVR